MSIGALVKDLSNTVINASVGLGHGITQGQGA